MSIIEILPRHSGSNRKKDYFIYVSSSLSKNVRSVVIGFSEKTLSKMRWIYGDKLKVAYDTETKMLSLERSQIGFAISCCNKNKNKKRAGPGVISFNSDLITKLSIHYLSESDCILSENKLEFIYPDASPVKSEIPFLDALKFRTAQK